MTPFKRSFNFTVAPPPGCTLSERFHAFLSSVILLPTGKTGKTKKVAIGVSLGAFMLIALVISIVCFARRRKACALSYQLTTVNARNTSSVRMLKGNEKQFELAVLVTGLTEHLSSHRLILCFIPLDRKSKSFF